MTALIIGVLIWVVLVEGALLFFAGKSRQKLEEEKAFWAGTYHQQVKNIETFVSAVLPLLEKTDWMTGRWNGQFDTLKRLENTRNGAVARATSAFARLPAVEATWQDKRLSLLTGSIAQVATDILPDDETQAVRHIPTTVNPKDYT
jgi:hypothetical protein